MRLLGVYDVRWPFLAEIHTAPLKRFVPSCVLQAVRALRNAQASLAVFLAGVAPVYGFETYRKTRARNVFADKIDSIKHCVYDASVFILICFCTISEWQCT